MKKAATKRLVYVVAGEASGDAIGGKLIRALNRRHADGPFQFRGVGGYRHHDHVVEDIRQSQPDAVVTIDSKGFCFRVLKSLQGITNRMDHRPPAIVHYVAPSIWAFKHKHRNAASTAQSLGLFIDHMLVLLPFEARLFNHHRTWTTFVGHPSVETFMDAHDLFRRHDHLSSVVPPSIATELESLSMTSEWLQPEAPALWPMQTAIASDVAVAVSGTVVIESLLAGTPTVVMYRANWLTEVIAAAVARVRFVSLPNILFDRELVPELVFSKCTSASLAHALSYRMYFILGMIYISL
ncbi:hypothetical protein DYB37_005994 [Aphanomyces astaci]|uniref:lipid-A-disaccharide synthase n=1 Tax=Aphanomyces astaci TaxID=112090 RepID=A0A3R7AUZ9_APHAT|nr:hypothetical protein DYB35_007226 [Aphanomyces astaci]RHZ25967.1 hypothetical protein DYB37_005994 [Aphanomyces astaci]